MEKYYVADKETGTIIIEVASIEEGKQIIENYESQDKKDGIYEEDFYTIVNEERMQLI